MFLPLYIVLSSRAKISRKVIFLLIFVGSIRVAWFFYDHGLYVPSTDTGYTVQLLNQISIDGHIQPGMGTFRSQSYSQYPGAFILGTIFLQVTSMNAMFFVKFLGPLVVSEFIVTIFSFLCANCLLVWQFGQPLY